MDIRTDIHMGVESPLIRQAKSRLYDVLTADLINYVDVELWTPTHEQTHMNLTDQIEESTKVKYILQ